MLVTELWCRWHGDFDDRCLCLKIYNVDGKNGQICHQHLKLVTNITWPKLSMLQNTTTENFVLVDYFRQERFRFSKKLVFKNHQNPHHKNFQILKEHAKIEFRYTNSPCFFNSRIDKNFQILFFIIHWSFLYWHRCNLKCKVHQCSNASK